ncbi:glutathione S-transferase family protein [Prochlorococcus marinus]|uniref:glutathione S-transferase family protein n=1 Tax=Prochlorococcus marinus TaxID=1219 RepID=UPI0022B3A955|nr:glutathione S-transferase family protein [Prochlorococcus marinus]
MLELYQFQHSPFCLKVRLGLAAKKISYRTVEITPGLGQIDVFKLSGQRQVPILKDGENVIADSSAIIQYLENITKESPLFPEDPQEASIVQIIEDWADTTFADSARLELIKATSIDSSLRAALFPEYFPQSFNGLIKNLPYKFMNNFTNLISQEKSNALMTSLKKLSISVSSNEWLVGNTLSIADIAVAAQLSLLRFPISSGTKLCHKGCPGFTDNPELESLFNWRDQLEKKLLETDPANL